MARSTRNRLDKQAVLQAAVDLLNADGVQALTLSRLAEKLGIQTPSLYNHVDGMAGLHSELAVLNARQIADHLSEAAIGRSGPALFVAVAQAFREYVKENPGLYLSTLRSSGTQPAQDPALVREEERALKVGLAIMASLGLQGEDAVHGLRGFRSLVHGFASLEVAGGFGLPQDCDESFRRLVTALVNGLQGNQAGV
ncbi:MAG: TetR/AcrR family transcriptional regulator [Chloroflexi bacterium]|nr:WHG domain-containing protein [Anaerolineaceae bacterium]NMB87869.1 TetR/AcrR family transcriptional regulator [Chloroflexota bacterium]